MDTSFDLCAQEPPLNADLFRVVNSKRKEPMLTMRLDDAPASKDLQADITLRMDLSRIQGPIKKERWVILVMLAERIDFMLRTHDRDLLNERQRQEDGERIRAKSLNLTQSNEGGES
jgi:hypothetical protein